ncbi:MAG TPA: DUF4349 domain-containing protein [Streptosporangiaceae bacterium]|jgi:hypothetical protein
MSAGAVGRGAARVPGALPAGRDGTANANAANGEAKAAQPTAALAPASQQIVYTASITVRAHNAAATARRVIGLAVAAGGYTAAEHVAGRSPGQPGPTISLTLKIPVPAYQKVLSQLSSPVLGKQLGMSQQASDVTQQVANVASLATSEQDAITALEGLLKQAGSVSGLLQVQQQISADQSELNSLQAQQRALNLQTTYGTVTMTLVSPPAAAHKRMKPPGKHSFLTGLTAGWHGLRRAAGWVATAVGTVLPFLIIALALAGLGWLVRRWILRRRPGPGPTVTS